MNDAVDKLSYAARLATDILFVRNPVGTSMGALTGVVLDGVVTAATPFVPVFGQISQAGVSVPHYMALGIVAFNFRTWLKRDEVDPKVSEALRFVEDQVIQGRLTRAQAKVRYSEIIAKVVESVRLDPETSERLKKLAE